MLRPNLFMFQLDTVSSAQKVLAASGRLKGQPIFISKDFTSQEQNTRYKLRKITKAIRAKNKSLKIKHGDLCIYINDIRFTFYNDKICAKSASDADFLKNIFSECEIVNEICINDFLIRKAAPLQK